MATDVLADLRSGDAESLARLMPLVRRELRELAMRQLAGGRGSSLRTTALVQATYQKLVDQSRAQLRDRTRFSAIAATAMRQVLVDYARARRARTGDDIHGQIALDEKPRDADAQAAALFWLNDAIDRLAEATPRIARTVECRFFGGLTEVETANVLGLDTAAVQRDWAKALMLLRRDRATSESAAPTGSASAPGRILPADWQRLEPLLDAVLDTPREQRPALVDELCDGNTALRSELEALVIDAEHGVPFLEQPVAECFSALCADAVEQESIVASLGDRYRVSRELGRGGMAVVYLARDVKHGRDVAVKVVHSEIAAALGRERFLREIEIVARLHHPHIVPLYDSGDVGGVLYYVMPYEPGHSLRDRLDREGRLPIPDAITILRDVCDALAYAHQQGIVHRDIKPDNVLLVGRHAVVTDFGVARAVSSATAASQPRITATGVTLGTPAYMAPEQIVSDPHIDHRVDVYAFGVLAYEVLVGRPPFAGDAPHRVLSAHLSQAPDPVAMHRPDVPPALDAIVLKCLEKDPTARWADAGELLARLERLGGEERVPDSTPAPVADPRSDTRPSGRGLPRTTVAIAAGALVTVAVAAGVLFLAGGDPPRLTIEKATPFTSDAGLELYPVLSPDGKLVAYSAGTSARMRIHVRPVGGGRTWTLSNDTSAIETHPRWSPDGAEILFLSRGSASIAPAFGGPVRQVAPRSANASVRAATWSSDGRDVAIIRGDSVLVYTADGARSRLVARGSEWHSCVWSPVGAWLACVAGNPRYAQPGAFFGNLGPSAILLVGTSDGRRIMVTDSGAASTNQSPQWSADGSRLLFVSDRDGARDIFAVTIGSDGRPRNDAVRLTTGLNVHSFSIDTSNSRLAYALYQEKANLWSLPIPDRPPVTIDSAVPLTTGSQVVEILRTSEDGQWLYYDSNLHGNSDIFRVRLPGGGDPERLTTHPNPDFAAAAAPSGRDFAFHRFHGGQRDVFVQRLSDGQAEQITATDAQECCAVWSSDGEALAIAHFDAEGGIFVMRRDASGRWGAPVRRLARGFLHDWSPDGRHIAVASGRAIRGTDHAERLEIIAPDSGDPVTLYAVRDTVNDPTVGDPQWAPDGSAIYFKSHDALGRASIWRQSIAGGAPQLLVRFDDPARPSFRPNFTTDGKQFFFTVNARESDIWLADLAAR